MSKPADQAARQKAQDIQCSFIVQAPAGSGKTELLTMRMLRLLAVVEQPEEILCITFTNKAAAEMKERILSSIEPAFTEQSYNEDHKNEKAQLGKRVYHRSQEKGWNLLLNPNRLAVRTIDSFNHFLVRQMPVLSCVGASVDIAEEPMELYQQAVRNLLELADAEAQQALKHLLGHLDNRYNRVEQRLIEMLAIRDQWLPMVLHENPEQMLQHIELNLQGLVETELQAIQKKLSAVMPVEFVERASQAGQNLMDADSKSPIGLLAGLNSIPDSSIHYLDTWKAIAELVLTKNDTVRKTLTKNEGFPAGKPNAPHKQEFLECLQTIAADGELTELLPVLKKLPYSSYPESQKQLMTNLFILLKTLYASLKMVFAEQQACDHGEISLAALHSLGTEQQPTDLALSLDYRFQHILIDEFQDTSNLQIQLLEKLTQGWQPNDGRSLFLVGDPMQSIYKFRQADVGIYLATQKNGIANIPLESLRLTANFRSQGALISWINNQFSLVFGNNNNWLHGEIAYSASVASRATLPTPALAVESFLFIDPPDHTAQAEKIIDLIAQARQQEPDGEIAILVRARSHLLAVVEQLKKAEVSFQAVEIDPLEHLPYIRDLQTLTRALCHPADRIAWLSLLRSPACGLTLESLLIVAGSDSRHTTIWDQLQNPEVIQLLDSDSRIRVERLVTPLRRCLNNLGRKPFRVLLEGCWLETGGMLLTDNPAELDNIDQFFNLIEKLTEGGQLPDTNTLSKRIQKLYAQPQTSGPNAVQIMTIHKAKGLEFTTVILPSLERKPVNNQDKLLNWHLYRNAQNCSELLLAPIQSTADDSQDSIGDYLKYIDQKRGENELKRLLYVASTRAKNRLFLLGNVKLKPIKTDNDSSETEDKAPLEIYATPVKQSLLGFLWPQILDQASCIEPAAAPVEETFNTQTDSLQQLPTNWQSDIEFISAEPVRSGALLAEAATNNELPEPEINITAAAIGTLVHRTLAQITEDGIEVWSQERIKQQLPVWRSQLQQLGIYEELDQAAETIQKQIKHCCAGQHGPWLVDSNHTDSQTEWPLTVKTSSGYKQYRVDRTFIDQNGIRWVIDYKSSQPTRDSENPSKTQPLSEFLQQQASLYQKQMQAYHDGFRQLEDRPIKLALYYPAIDRLQVL